MERKKCFFFKTSTFLPTHNHHPKKRRKEIVDGFEKNYGPPSSVSGGESSAASKLFLVRMRRCCPWFGMLLIGGRILWRAPKFHQHTFSRRSSAIQEGLKVVPLLLHIESSHTRWLRHLIWMHPGRLPGEVLWACPTGRRARGDPGHAEEYVT